MFLGMTTYEPNAARQVSMFLRLHMALFKNQKINYFPWCLFLKCRIGEEPMKKYTSCTYNSEQKMWNRHNREQHAGGARTRASTRPTLSKSLQRNLGGVVWNVWNMRGRSLRPGVWHGRPRTHRPRQVGRREQVHVRREGPLMRCNIVTLYH